MKFLKSWRVTMITLYLTLLRFRNADVMNEDSGGENVVTLQSLPSSQLRDTDNLSDSDDEDGYIPLGLLAK